MSVQNENASNNENEGSIDVLLKDDEDWLKSIAMSESAPPPASSSVRIRRVPNKDGDQEKYYVPNFVSIGPYHSRDSKLVRAEKLKPVFTKKLIPNMENVRILYNELGEPTMVQKLRGFYEETSKFSDTDFTRMMLLDGCFILYCIHEKCNGLNDREVESIYQDFLLLENQIPFIVLNKVAKITQLEFDLGSFIRNSNIMITLVRERDFKVAKVVLPNSHYDHLLHFWHHALTSSGPEVVRPIVPVPKPAIRTVNELMDAGIHFCPSSHTNLYHIDLLRSWRLFSATLKLPPITIDDYTEQSFLNLLAYEKCSQVEERKECRVVTSYIRLLRYLINKPEDVNALREARVLQHSLGSDNEVVKLFKELGSDLMLEYDNTYLKAFFGIEKQYESFKKCYTAISELKREYFKSPWKFFALVGAILALFLTAVQTYFTVWSRKAECDDLCKYLKMNHHL